MILDYFNLMINRKVLSQIQYYVCVVGIQYVLGFVDLDNPTDPIEPVGVVVRHELVFPAPLMHPPVDGIVDSYPVLPVKAHDQLV